MADDTPSFAEGASFLIVEDEAIIAMMLEVMLTDAGARHVEIAASVATALSLIEANTFDIAIFDRQLGDGLSYPAALAAQARGTVVILVSGASAFDRPHELGDAQLLAKPFELSELQRAVVAALTQRQPSAMRN